MSGFSAGILVLRHPLLAAFTVPTVIVIVLGVQGLIMGVLEIIGGFTGGGLGSFIIGVIYVLAGLLLLSSPIGAALAVPLVFGVLLLIQGVACVSSRSASARREAWPAAGSGPGLPLRQSAVVAGRGARDRCVSSRSQPQACAICWSREKTAASLMLRPRGAGRDAQADGAVFEGFEGLSGRPDHVEIVPIDDLVGG